MSGENDEAVAYPMLNTAARPDWIDAIAAIRAGLADVDAGRTKPARAALAALARKYGIESSGKYRY